MKKPEQVIILGIPYEVSYVDNPADVDLRKRKCGWGQIDYWTRTIRIYDYGRGEVDIWGTILEETLHGIGEAFRLNILRGKENHTQVRRLALALSDTLFRNGWFQTEKQKSRRQ